MNTLTIKSCLFYTDGALRGMAVRRWNRQKKNHGGRKM